MARDENMSKEIVLEELERTRPIHMVGIGGAGMSAIATVLLQMGFMVEGSDIKESPNIRRVRLVGATVGIGHRADNVGTASLVVASSAIRDDNPEILEARRKNISVVARAEMLAAIMSGKRGIAVAGTHGKTTTSSLVAQALYGCGADPSFLIGGELNEIGGNARHGAGEFLVAEADESDGSLLYLKPEAAILTNADVDHVDYFNGGEHVACVFLDFLQRVTGFAVICYDDERARETGRKYESGGGKAIYYGADKDCDFRFSDAKSSHAGVEFDAFRGDEPLGTTRCAVPGVHNAYNALAAIAMGVTLGFPAEGVVRSIGEFRGVRRRFETVGSARGVTVIDDYAHHPTEIAAVLAVAKELATSRLVVVFQPHRYSRTRTFAGDFASSLSLADLLVITDVYAAGEDPEPGVSGQLIVDGIESDGKKVYYVQNRLELARSVVPLLEEGDMLITMGAGDVTQCAREILELLEE